MDQPESALERLRTKLILAFQFNLRDLADLMHREGFLSDSDHQTVTAVASLHNESDKAGIMVKSLINKVKINGEHYQTFLKLVQREQRKYSDVVLLLTSGVSMTSERNSVCDNHKGIDASPQPMQQDLEAERVQERKKTSASGSVKQHEDPLIIVCFDCEELVCQRCTLKDHKDHKYEIFLSKISLEALANLCLTQANITIAVDPAKCTVDLTARAEVGKPCVLILTTRLSNGKPDNGKCEVTCHIKSLYNGETTDCAIDKDGTGRYSIKYTPAVRGRHELTVLINGHHVAGSPFPVYASIHPTQLGEPVKIWTTEKQPYTITGNSKREIFVDLCGGGIVKFDSKGNRRDMIMECDRSEHCIACDSKDKIYFMRGKNIATCDGNGDNVQIHGELENQKDPKSLAISDENLIVAEVNSIKVYNKQLQYIATFEHNNMSMDIVDISVDIHQNIYVTDKKEKSCHIFKDRKYVSSFKSSLKCPRGLCVHHQYVYVADVSRHCIRVFTTDGGYVTSFGQRGQERGQFCWPSFVYVDEDGFIYVTDMDNKRIQCF